MPQSESFFDDGDQNVYSDGDPDLGFNGVGRISKETLNTQVLLDPFEEQFNLPTVLVNGGDGLTRNRKIVSDEDEVFVDIGGEVMHATHGDRVSFQALASLQEDRLIAAHTRGRIDRAGIPSAKLEIVLGAENKEGQRLLETI